MGVSDKTSKNVSGVLIWYSESSLFG